MATRSSGVWTVTQAPRTTNQMRPTAASNSQRRPLTIPRTPPTKISAICMAYTMALTGSTLRSYLGVHGPSLLGIPSPCLDGFLRPDLWIAVLRAVRPVEVDTQHLPNVQQLLHGLSQTQPHLVVPRRLHLGVEPAGLGGIG